MRGELLGAQRNVDSAKTNLAKAQADLSDVQRRMDAEHRKLADQQAAYERAQKEKKDALTLQKRELDLREQRIRVDSLQAELEAKKAALKIAEDAAKAEAAARAEAARIENEKKQKQADLDLENQKQDALRWQRFMDISMMIAYILLSIVGLILLVVLARLVISLGHRLADLLERLLNLFIRWRQSKIVPPDANGMYPTTIDQLSTVAPLVALAYHETRLLEAGKPNAPHTYTYAPHTASRTIPDEEKPQVTTQLLTVGKVGEGRPIIFGYSTNGAPIVGTFKDLLSVAIVGKSGSGKTSLQRLLACQVVMSNAARVDRARFAPQSSV